MCVNRARGSPWKINGSDSKQCLLVKNSHSSPIPSSENGGGRDVWNSGKFCWRKSSAHMCQKWQHKGDQNVHHYYVGRHMQRVTRSPSDPNSSDRQKWFQKGPVCCLFYETSLPDKNKKHSRCGIFSNSSSDQRKSQVKRVTGEKN